MRPINTLVLLTCTAFAAAVVAATAPVDEDMHTANRGGDDDRKTLTLNVYALDTCPVSGEKLGSMGDPVVKEYEFEGAKREVRFCCGGCVDPFESDMPKYFAEIDRRLIEQQKPHYPLENCLVSGRPLAESETVTDLIYEGRLVRFCCPNCPARFKADPDRYLKRLDEAIIKQQREHYPLDTCVVGNAELGSMGEPHEVIVGGTLVRFCCAGCLGGFKENPAAHLATIRAAWAKRHEKHDHDHDDDHDHSHD